MTYLDQFNQLRLQVPRLGLQCTQNENSPYCQYTEKSKNCYMTFASYQSEDCYYNHRVFYCTDCMDCTLCYKCELCYYCVDCINSYNSNYCCYCEQVIDCEHCHYCIGTKNCFGCVGLRQKHFHIFNKSYTKAEFEKQMVEIKKMPISQIYSYIQPLLLQTPRAAIYGKKLENSFGENIHNCKNTYWAFDSKYLEDCYYCYHCDESKDLYDCSHLGWSENCYQIMSGGNLNNCSFCYGCWNSANLEYCDSVHNSHDCFLCVSLNHGTYCILNKPCANKEEYLKRVAEIKKEMDTKWFPSTYPEVITVGL